MSLDVQTDYTCGRDLPYDMLVLPLQLPRDTLSPVKIVCSEDDSPASSECRQHLDDDNYMSPYLPST